MAQLVSNANTDCRTRYEGKNIISSSILSLRTWLHVDGRQETNQDNEQFQIKWVETGCQLNDFTRKTGRLSNPLKVKHSKAIKAIPCDTQSAWLHKFLVSSQPNYYQMSLSNKRSWLFAVFPHPPKYRSEFTNFQSWNDQPAPSLSTKVVLAFNSAFKIRPIDPL